MRKYSRVLMPSLLGAAILASALPAMADYKAGMNALGVKDYARARAEFEAEPDNGAAVYQLSRMATLGWGEARNDARAASLLRRATELGHAAAVVDYAYALGNGRGVAKDAAEAVRILEGAAATDLRAMVTLGRVLRYGWWGAPKDEAKAAALFENGMQRGDVAAATLYALSLLAGAGVAKDEPRAVELLRQSADRGYDVAQLELARILMRGEGAPKDEPAAVALYRKVAETGSAAAQYSLALAYSNGSGVARDAAAAARWVDASARQGYAWSQYLLADWFQRGLGVPRILSEAYFWYSLAAKGSEASIAQRANERRALLAKDMTETEIARILKKVAAFVPQTGFRPRPEALPALAHGDQVKIGPVSLRVAAPAGYANGWEMQEWLQQAYPNDPEMRPMLMVLAHQEDMQRVKLRVPTSYRFIEVTSELSDHSVAVTPALFGDIRKKLRDALEASVKAGRYRLEQTVADDERSYAFVRAGLSQADRIDAVAMVLAKQRLLVFTYRGFRPEHLAELSDLVKKTVADVQSGNSGGLFSQ